MQTSNTATAHSSKCIFISHATVDKEIADKVVDLLNTAMGIDVQNDVFCSSLEGIKVPAGLDFKQFIKDQIQEPRIVVLLISQNYLASQFCLAELGASWAMSHRIIPMLIPPVRYDDMKAVLVNIHTLNIDNPSDWNEALAVFKEMLRIDPNVNRWERKRDEQLEKIKALMPIQTASPIVPLAKLEAAEKRLGAANEEIHGLEQEVSRLKEINEKLKSIKDADAVARIEIESWYAPLGLERTG